MGQPVGIRYCSAVMWLVIFLSFLRTSTSFQSGAVAGGTNSCCNIMPSSTVSTTPPHLDRNARSLTATTTSTALFSSWREYVPLGVSVAVIVDILLGSPAANAALSFARPKELGEEGKDGKRDTRNSKERVDSQKVAAAAIEKAQNALELRRFLDDTKSDWDRIQEKQRDIERQQRQFDDQSPKP